MCHQGLKRLLGSVTLARWHPRDCPEQGKGWKEEHHFSFWESHKETAQGKTQYKDQALILKGQWVYFKCYCSVEAGNFGINIENAVWDYLKVACTFGEILADIFI